MSPSALVLSQKSEQSFHHPLCQSTIFTRILSSFGEKSLFPDTLRSTARDPRTKVLPIPQTKTLSHTKPILCNHFKPSEAMLSSTGKYILNDRFKSPMDSQNARLISKSSYRRLLRSQVTSFSPGPVLAVQNREICSRQRVPRPLLFTPQHN